MTGDSGAITFQVQGGTGQRLLIDDVLPELEELLGEHVNPLEVVKVHNPSGFLFDLPAEQGRKLMQVSARFEVAQLWGAGGGG